jgi:hypothetical protein
MPGASELERLEQEAQPDKEQFDKALAYDTLAARAKRLGFNSVSEVLDCYEEQTHDRQ